MPDDLEMCIKEIAHFPNLTGSRSVSGAVSEGTGACCLSGCRGSPTDLNAGAVGACEVGRVVNEIMRLVF